MLDLVVGKQSMHILTGGRKRFVMIFSDRVGTSLIGTKRRKRGGFAVATAVMLVLIASWKEPVKYNRLHLNSPYN